MSHSGDVPHLGFRPPEPRVLGMGNTNSPSGPMEMMEGRAVPTPWGLHPRILPWKQQHCGTTMDLVSMLSLESGVHRVFSES